LKPKEIAERLGKSRESVRILLKRMLEAGLIEVGEDGAYRAPDSR